MKLWSIQSREAFSILNRDGVLYCSNPATAIYLDDGENGAFSRAYAWMANQMERRIKVPRPENALFPLWAWAQVGSYKKEYHPDSSDFVHGSSVLLELDVPDEELLLSDFDIWHCVLSGSGAYTDKRMEKRLARYYDENGFKKPEVLPQDLRDYVVSSWERVFDLDRRDRYFSKMRRNRFIQASMWQIRSEWVRSSTSLSGK